jgi:Protein chain release factor B
MNCEELRKRIHAGEFIFSTSRSSGPGGQNVNKVNTKVELRFNICKAESLSEIEKEKLLVRLKSKITLKGDLLIISQSERTQLLNKQKAEEKFYKLICSALKDKPERKATAPTVASARERLKKKKKRSSLKNLRKESVLDNDD